MAEGTRRHRVVTDRRFKGRRSAAALAGAAAVGVLSVALLGSAAAPASSGPQGHAAGGCVYRDHVTAIIDDSNSMGGDNGTPGAGTDPTENRVAFNSLFFAADILDHKLRKNLPRRDYAAAEFGTDAAAIFGPTPITEKTATKMAQDIDDAVNGDENLTDYNDAFTVGNGLNPAQNGRIFLTDGGHNQGPYLNGHGTGPPTQVISLNVQSASDLARLQKIASDTGGELFELNQSAQLLPAMFAAFSNLSCLRLFEKLTKLPDPGKSKTAISVRLKPGDKGVTLNISLEGVAVDLKVLKFLVNEKGKTKHVISSKGGSGASAAAKENCKDKKKRKGGKKGKPKLGVSCTGSEDFLVAQLKGKKGKSLKKAVGKKLKVKVKTPKDLLFPDTARLSTQVSVDR